MKKIVAIIGARPQFIKHFPFELAAKGKLDLVTIHTGQHYDANMSTVFFDELGMQKPQYMLDLGGGSHGAQTGIMLIEIEKILQKEKPDFVVVYGDTNSTLAGALAASKMHIPIVHIEAGLRSYNKQMPEEVNRVLTDHISDLLLVPSDVAVQNLSQEGIHNNVHVVGDIMKDLTIKAQEEGWIPVNTQDEPYIYVTLHRPYNTDNKDRLSKVLNWLNLAEKKVVFAIHPRTSNMMKTFGLNAEYFTNIDFISPQSYFNNLGYLFHSDMLVTDSGGMQKECYWLSKKCITVRSETEWIETTATEANTLVFEDLDTSILNKDYSHIFYDSTLYGNGQAGKNIIDNICNFC